jgi:hypothetical protein
MGDGRHRDDGAGLSPRVRHLRTGDRPAATSAQEYLPAVTVVICVALLALGVWMLSGREITLLMPKSDRGAPTARLGLLRDLLWAVGESR